MLFRSPLPVFVVLVLEGFDIPLKGLLLRFFHSLLLLLLQLQQPLLHLLLLLLEIHFSSFKVVVTVNLSMMQFV